MKKKDETMKKVLIVLCSLVSAGYMLAADPSVYGRPSDYKGVGNGISFGGVLILVGILGFYLIYKETNKKTSESSTYGCLFIAAAFLIIGIILSRCS